MSRFYIQVQQTEAAAPVEIYELTSTTDLSIIFRGGITRHPVEDGTNITDHRVSENVQISFNGVITDILNLSLPSLTTFNSTGQNPQTIPTQKSVEDNFVGLRDLERSSKPFTVFFDNNQQFQNCVFSDLNFSRTSGMGTSYNVSMNMEQVQISDAAQFSTIVTTNQSDEISDQHSAKSDSGDESTLKQNPSLLRKFILGIFNTFSGEENNGSGN